MPTILIPLPDQDADPTELAVPWKIFVDAGCDVVFATEQGATPAADPKVLEGVIFGQLGAEPEPVAFYRELEREPGFLSPRRLADVDPSEIDGVFLVGGHAPGMKQYLESEAVFRHIHAAFEADKAVGAICHGVLAVARAKDPATGRSVIHGRKSTCLPTYMERLAYYVTAWKLGRYYRTYDTYVQEEVEAALGPDGTFVRGPIHLFSRGTMEDDSAGFVVEDGNYVSARWPGDAYLIAKRFVALAHAQTSARRRAA